MCTDIFSKNVFPSKDFTYRNLKNIIEVNKLVIVSGDKDLCIVIMEKEDYYNKLQGMIDDRNSEGIYAKTITTTLFEKKFRFFAMKL